MDPRERLVQLISEAGISQTELARRVGESTQWVNNRARGESRLKADDMTRLAGALGVPPSAFFEEPSLAEVLLVAVTSALAEMPPKYRRQLWDLVAQQNRRLQPSEDESEERDVQRADLAERLSSRLSQLFQALPDDEKGYMREMLAGDHTGRR